MGQNETYTKGPLNWAIFGPSTFGPPPPLSSTTPRPQPPPPRAQAHTHTPSPPSLPHSVALGLLAFAWDRTAGCSFQSGAAKMAKARVRLVTRGRSLPQLLIIATSVVLLFLYPTLNKRTTMMNKCTTFPVNTTAAAPEGDADGARTRLVVTGNRSVLNSDYAVDCVAPEYRAVEVVSLCFFFLYGAGIPLLFPLVGLSLRLIGGAELEMDTLAFLFVGFKKEYRYWESVNMVRKLFIAAIMTFSNDLKLKVVCPPPPQGCIGRGGWYPAPLQYAQPLSPRRQVPASMALVTDSNRSQPLWQPPQPPAYPPLGPPLRPLPSLLMHPCPPAPPPADVPMWVVKGRGALVQKGSVQTRYRPVGRQRLTLLTEGALQDFQEPGHWEGNGGSTLRCASGTPGRGPFSKGGGGSNACQPVEGGGGWSRGGRCGARPQPRGRWLNACSPILSTLCGLLDEKCTSSPVDQGWGGALTV